MEVLIIADDLTGAADTAAFTSGHCRIALSLFDSREHLAVSDCEAWAK